jgi:hypothetical protein
VTLPLSLADAGPARRGSQRSAWARAQGVLSWLLLLVGALRLFGLVAAEPLAGYANQYDMIRTAACLGLWPERADGSIESAHPQAPFTRYRRGERQHDACVPSASVALVGLVAGVDRAAERSLGAPDNGVDLREVGLFQAVLLLAIALWLQISLRARPGWQLGQAGFFALVLADPFNTLWLNSLYTEAGALLGAYLGVAGLLAIALEARPSRSAAVALVLGCGLLGASRVQHLLLPFVVLLLAAWVLHRRGTQRPGLLVVGTALALAALGFQASVQSGHPKLASANRSDALFGALLPAAVEPGALVAKLGLPQGCVELTHTSWYLQRGRDAVAECPQAFALSQTRLLATLLTEPTTLATALAKGQVLATAWRLPYLGEVAERETARVAPGGLGLQRSLADPIAPLGLRATVFFWLAPLLGGVAAGLRRLPSRRRRRDASSSLALDALFAFCAAAIGMVWLASVLGDGYSETARHLQLAQNAVLLGWLLLATASIKGAVSFWRRREAVALSWPLITLATFAVAGALATLSTRLPLAFGALQQPASDSVAPGTITLQGRALDARGIERIEARLDGVSAAQLRLAPSVAIAQMFPIAGAAAGREFSGSVELGDRRPSGLLEIVVINRDGVSTVIDRRWLRPP